ncbi:hypothetical protein FOS14_07080 [Skermania sp. ID1734]|uniref:hypothetical protein n=1 Tax=Skermania sp. ID1734 TaxID=2597516 RepID=UPI0011811EAC|nr:hypothetical protein [Skermania sp. ID1734]TSE00766.1 hypothetical protein FOS14_07080 [Skermania sp. ID1734]
MAVLPALPAAAQPELPLPARSADLPLPARAADLPLPCVWLPTILIYPPPPQKFLCQTPWGDMVITVPPELAFS